MFQIELEPNLANITAVNPNMYYTRLDLIYKNVYVLKTTSTKDVIQYIPIAFENDHCSISSYMVDISKDLYNAIFAFVYTHWGVDKFHMQHCSVPFKGLKQTRHYLLQLPNTYQEYLGQFTSKSRNNLRREKLSLEQMFNCKYVHLSSHDLNSDFFECFIQQAAQTKQEMHITAQQLQKMTTDALVLMANGKPISIVLYNKIEGSTDVACISMSYDPAYKAYGPGKILYYHFIKNMTEQNMKRIYMGGGDYGYKKNSHAEETITYNGCTKLSTAQKILFSAKHLMKKKKKTPVIVRTDGGICSQIAFYAYGLELESRGFDVSYDLNWFKSYALDTNGQHRRIYSIEQAFPNIHTKECDIKQWRWLRKWRRHSGIFAKDVKKATYVSGYPTDRTLLFIKHLEFFRNNFAPIDSQLCENMISRITAFPSCAVHVRRGDLSGYNPAYGFPPSVDYFIQAIEFIKSRNKDVTFYFFSDEIDWVQAVVVPKLSLDTKYALVDSFDSDKGYLDLYTMSHADYVVASQGSFGIFAALLSKKQPLLIMSRYNQNILDHYPNCMYINEDIKQKQLQEKKGQTE